MVESRITERREFDQLDGSEEVRFCLHEKDRIKISDAAGNFIITIQDDEEGRAEISILEGRATVYM